MKTTLSFIICMLCCTLSSAQPSFTLDKISFQGQHIQKVSADVAGAAFVIKGPERRKVAVVSSSGHEADLTSRFTGLSDKAFNDIQCTDSSYVFIATNGDYLLRYNGTTVNHLKQEHGLQNGLITSLAGRRTLYLGNSLGLFNSISRGFSRFSSTYLLNNPTIGMRYTERAEIFTVDRGLNFQYQHPPVMPHYCNYRSRFTQFIVPANLHYRTQSFAQGVPDTSHVYTAHHVVPYTWGGYNTYNMYHYIGTRAGLRKAPDNSCRATVYMPRRSIYKLLELRTYPYETFGTPELEQRYLLTATDSGLYVSSITPNYYDKDTFQLVPGTAHLKVYDLDTDACYSKIWLATDQGLYAFSVQHQLQVAAQELSHTGTQYVCFSPYFRISTKLEQGYTIQWFKDDEAIPNATGPYYDATEPGMYKALLTLDCYGTITTAAVTLLHDNLAAAPITVQGSRQKCPEEQVTLETPYKQHYTYQWYRDDEPLELPETGQHQLTTTEAGKYQVEVVNCYGTSVLSETVVISNNDVPLPVITYATNRVCRGDTLELEVQAYAGKIEWLVNGSPVALGTGEPTKFIAKASSPNSTYSLYQARFTNEHGCSSTSDYLYIYFSPPPAFTISKLLPEPACAGESQQLKVNRSSYNHNITVLWSTGSVSEFIEVDKPGRYYVTLTDRSSGCTTTDSVDVQFKLPPALLVPADTFICEASLTPLTITAGAADAVYHVNGIRQQDNIIRVSKAGTYEVTVTDASGCTTTKTMAVNNFCNDFIIPNIITPNGDNLNDWFVIQNLVPNCNLKVYSRAGALLYQNSNYQNNWQGDNLPAGTYYYQISNASLNRSWKGWLEIIR